MFPLDDDRASPHPARTTSTTSPPPGVKMANPEGDHAAILESGRWKEAVQAYLATIAYTDAEHRPPARRPRRQPPQGQHHHRPLGRPRLAPRRETPLAQVRPLGGGHPRPLHLGRPRRDPARTPSATRPSISSASTRPSATSPASPTPAHVEGHSIRPLLADPPAHWDHAAITTHGYKNHAVRTDRLALHPLRRRRRGTLRPPRRPLRVDQPRQRVEVRRREVRPRPLPPHHECPRTHQPTPHHSQKRSSQGTTRPVSPGPPADSRPPWQVPPQSAKIRIRPDEGNLTRCRVPRGPLLIAARLPLMPAQRHHNQCQFAWSVVIILAALILIAPPPAQSGPPDDCSPCAVTTTAATVPLTPAHDEPYEILTPPPGPEPPHQRPLPTGSPSRPSIPLPHPLHGQPPHRLHR